MEPITFSIVERTYPMVKEGQRPQSIADFEFIPFGPEYSGDFILKHPNLGDQLKISALRDNSLIGAGYKTTADAPPLMVEQEYAFAAVAVLALEDLSKPAWFKKDQLSTYIDQWAVIEVGRSLQEAIETKKKPPTVDSKGNS